MLDVISNTLAERLKVNRMQKLSADKHDKQDVSKYVMAC